MKTFLLNKVYLLAAGTPSSTSAFNDGMDLLAKGVGIVGALLVALGVVNLGANIKDQNGPALQTCIMQIVGGVIIGGAAVCIGQIKF